jgi:hypothetical protein
VKNENNAEAIKMPRNVAIKDPMLTLEASASAASTQAIAFIVSTRRLLHKWIAPAQTSAGFVALYFSV